MISQRNWKEKRATKRTTKRRVKKENRVQSASEKVKRESDSRKRRRRSATKTSRDVTCAQLWPRGRVQWPSRRRREQEQPKWRRRKRRRRRRRLRRSCRWPHASSFFTLILAFAFGNALVIATIQFELESNLICWRRCCCTVSRLRLFVGFCACASVCASMCACVYCVSVYVFAPPAAAAAGMKSEWIQTWQTKEKMHLKWTPATYTTTTTKTTTSGATEPERAR